MHPEGVPSRGKRRRLGLPHSIPLKYLTNFATLSELGNSCNIWVEGIARKISVTSARQLLFCGWQRCYEYNGWRVRIHPLQAQKGIRMSSRTPEDITILLATTKNFAEWIGRNTTGLEMAGGRRERIALALLHHSLDVVDGAYILLAEKGLPGAALALTRPMIEAYGRAMWVLHNASEEDLPYFMSRKELPKPLANKLRLLRLPRELRHAAPETANWIEAQLGAGNRDILNGLTHGGPIHVRHRISHNVVAANYPPDLIVRWLWLGISIRMKAGGTILKMFDEANGIDVGFKSLDKYVCENIGPITDKAQPRSA